MNVGNLVFVYCGEVGMKSGEPSGVNLGDPTQFVSMLTWVGTNRQIASLDFSFLFSVYMQSQ